MKTAFIITGLITILSFTACKPFKISMSNDLGNATELNVKGRNGILINQKLSFGEYKTAKVNRSWTEGSSVNGGAMKTLWVTYSQKQQSFHFSLSDSSGNTSETFCLAKTRSEDWTAGSNPNSLVNIMADVLGIGGNSDNTFAVNVYLPKEAAPWEMMIDMQQAQLHSKHYIGYLAKTRDEYYTIHPVTSVESSGKKSPLPFGSAGFEVRNKAGIALAAVSLIDNGKVYLGSTDPKERFLLANACTALLLHQTM